jgi:hypothetical protein
MKRWLTAGSIFLVVGLLKIWQHTSAPLTLEDYLAFRCGSAAGSHADSFLSFAGHCWGCPVAAIGAAMIIVAMASALTTVTRQPVRRAIPARQR